MFVAEVAFRPPSDPQSERTIERINALLGAWRMNGQILGREFPLVQQETAYLTFLMLPAADSLSHHHDNHWVTLIYEELRAGGEVEPSVRILGESPDSLECCSCGTHDSYILYTDHLSLESCLRCGTCFGPVPLYSVPSTADGEYYDVLCWQSDYQACDQLQMNCRTGERFGLREMSRPDSSLSTRGREICRKIEAGTGTPTYYYLHRYWGKSFAYEWERPCPACGGAWRLEAPLHDRFDFRCDDCRLLSNIALTTKGRMRTTSGS